MSRKQTDINEKIQHYIRDTFVKEEEFLAELVEKSRKAGFPQISISPEQGRFLRFLLKSIKAKHVIEIGSLFGYSAISMAWALPEDGKLIAVEMNPDYAEFIMEQCRLAGVEKKVDVVAENALSFLSAFKPEKKFDFVFLDADKVNYIKYFDMLNPLLRKGGIMAADNALAFGFIAEDEIGAGRKADVLAMREFNKMLSTHPQFFSSLLQMGDGLAIGIKI